MESFMASGWDGDRSRQAALAGLLVIVVLIAAGLLLLHQLKPAAGVQDCVIAGRSDCAPVRP